MYQPLQPLSLYLSVYHWNASHLSEFTSHRIPIQFVDQASPPNTCDPLTEGENHTIINLSFHTSDQPPGMPVTIKMAGVSLPTIALHAYITLTSCVDCLFLFLHNRALQFTLFSHNLPVQTNLLATTLPDRISLSHTSAQILHKV